MLSSMACGADSWAGIWISVLVPWVSHITSAVLCCPHWLQLACRQQGLLSYSGSHERILNVRYAAKMPPSRGLRRNRRESSVSTPSQLAITVNSIPVILKGSGKETPFPHSTAPKSSAGRHWARRRAKNGTPNSQTARGTSELLPSRHGAVNTTCPLFSQWQKQSQDSKKSSDTGSSKIIHFYLPKKHP